MGPIRNLLDRIRERRMERLSSRQGLFPRLRNLINPLDSQGMMDRAQGTRVGGSLSKPLTYDRRLVPDAPVGSAQPTATPTGTVAGKGKAPSVMEQDMAAVEKQRPTNPLDPMAQADHYDRQAAVMAGQARTVADPNERLRLQLEAKSMGDRAHQLRTMAIQKGQVDSSIEAEQKRRDDRTGLAGATRDLSQLQQSVAEGRTTPLMAASLATKKELLNRDTPPTPAEQQMIYAENLRQFVGPSYARATFATRKGLTPDSPVYGELRTAFADLPDADRTQALQTYVAPHLLNGYLSEGAAALTKQFGRPPTEDEMARLNEDGTAWTEGQIAKISKTLTPPSSRVFPKTREAIGNVDPLATADSAFAGALNLAGQAAQSVAPTMQAFLKQIMARPTTEAALPAAAPMAQPVAQPAVPVAPRRPVPTYPNGQPRKMPTPIPDYRK